MKTKKVISVTCSILQIIGFVCIAIVLICKINKIELPFTGVLSAIIVISGIAAIIAWFLQTKTLLSLYSLIAGIGLVVFGTLGMYM